MRYLPRTKDDQLAGVPRFFRAALEALQLSGASPRRLHELNDAGWHALLSFCDLAHLTLPLVMTCQAAAPEWVVSQAKQNLVDNRIRMKRIESAYGEIA